MRVDEIHRLLCKGSVNANQVAAEGKNAQYNSDDSKDGDCPWKGGIVFFLRRFAMVTSVKD